MDGFQELALSDIATLSLGEGDRNIREPYLSLPLSYRAEGGLMFGAYRGLNRNLYSSNYFDVAAAVNRNDFESQQEDCQMNISGDVQMAGGDPLTGVVAGETPALQAAVQTAENLLKIFVTDPDFSVKMQMAFGNSWDVEKAGVLAQSWAKGDFRDRPPISIRPSAEINGANGAFAAATNTIYLSQEFVSRNEGNGGAIASVLLEEYGHYIDSQINTSDTPGDEGEIFSAFVNGKNIEPQPLQQMQAEDDTAIVTLDGKTIQIEQAEVSDSGGFEGSQQILKLDSKGGGVVKYSYEHFFIPDNFILRSEGKNILETGFVGGGKEGIVQIPKGNSDELEVILATNDEGTQWNYKVTTTSRKPVLIVPGIAGTFVAPNNYNRWILNRGLNPNELVIDPLARTYDDLIATLENAGYKRGEDLFVATYDWRLPPGPNDGSKDGTISGISANSITDNTYEYGVDYLGYWLRQASEKWKERFPDADPLESVDVIAHSTGGLVTRTYIQSDAYGGSFGNLKLPKVDNFVMLGVPNEGAPKAWNPINDDWDADAAYTYVLRQFANVPYQKLLQGQIIAGPTPITQATVIAQSGNPDLNSRESKEAFIDQYVPTIKALLATYNFGAVVSPNKQNTFLLDLNAAGGSGSVTNNSNTTVIFGTNSATITAVLPRTGPSTFFDPLQSFTDRFDRQPQDNEAWWEEFETRDGDGTVPVRSATFVPGNIRPFSGVEHGALPHDEGVQRFVLETLGAQLEEGKEISTGKTRGSLGALKDIWNFTEDPVDGFLVDSQGRRLGYSEATGAVTEIPNSVWFGDNNGIGWIFGSVDTPATLQLTGLGEDHYVQVSGQQGTQVAGVESSGFLQRGEQKNLNLQLIDIPQDPNAEPFGGDLQVSKLVSPNPVPLRENLTYTVTVTNKGQNNSTGVILTDYFSNEMNFISATSSKGTVSQSNGEVNVDIGSLNSGETVTATITVLPVVAGTLTSTANVSSAEADPDLTNNSITVGTTINPVTPASADLELTKTVDNANPNVGDQITFTLSLTNKGPGVASSIKVTDLLPPGLSFVSANSIQGTYDNNTGVWDVGNMRDNLTRTLNIVAKVDNIGAIATTAAVTAVSETDPNPTNNQSSVTLTTIGGTNGLTIVFDENYYRDRYPDVKNAIAPRKFRSGYDHFRRWGVNEKRDFQVRLVDENYYLAQYPDVAAAIGPRKFTSGLDHFNLYGQFEGRKPNSLNQRSFRLQFDEGYYLAQNSDVAAVISPRKFKSGFEHFILYGQFENRKPNSSNTYLSAA